MESRATLNRIAESIPRIVVLLASLVLLVVLPTHAGAQEDPASVEDDGAETAGIGAKETVLWLFTGDDDRRIEVVRGAVKLALADDASSHILNEKALTEHMTRSSARVPGCFRGLEACTSPIGIAFEALEVSSLVRVALDGSKCHFELVDPRGVAVKSGDLEERDPRALGFAVVREIFDATGVLTFQTEPAGASVELDDKEIGTTPLTYRVAVGKHSYRLRLRDHQVIEGDVEVASGRGEVLGQTFAQLPGTLIVQDAPDGAVVNINGKYAGKVGEPISLPAGNYALDVVADGYAPMHDAVTINPGQTAKRSAPMALANPFLKDISAESIIFNNYILRFGFEYGLQRSTFQDARSNTDPALEFAGFADENGDLPTDAVLERTLGAPGFRFDASYGLKNFGIVLLSLSYLSKGTQLDAFVDAPGAGTLPVKVTSVRRLQLRPFQVFYRHFIQNFVPFAEAGIGVNLEWLRVEGASFATGGERLRRSDALWTLALGAQYYFSPNFFGLFRYSIQDYFDRGIGSDHMVSVGIGAAFPNLLGLDSEPPEQL